MSISLLFQKILPLYGIMALGFLLKKTEKIDPKTLGFFLIYFVAPVVILNAAWRLDPERGVLFAPFMIFGIGTSISIAFYFIGKRFFKDSRANLLSLCSGTANTAYFGLPIAAAFFDGKTLAVYIYAIMGNVIFENTVGFFICSSGRYSKKESLKNVATLPNVYALLIGLCLNYFEISPPNLFDMTIPPIHLFYTTCGMLILGLNINKESLSHIDLPFSIAAFSARFVCWPLSGALIYLIDKTFFNLFSPTVYQCLTLISLVPFAANTVVIASYFDVLPKKMASTVFLSYIFGLIYIPLIGNWVLK